MNVPHTQDQPRRTARLLAGVVALTLLLAGCASSDDGDAAATAESAATVETTAAAVEPSSDDTGTDPASDVDVEAADGGLDVDRFFDGAIEDVTVEDCTLSGGAETTCYSVTVAGYPVSYETGPFCPTTITDETGGLWWDGEAVYDLNGEFIADLAEIYGDDSWQMYDEDGNVLVTETAEEFELAARPDVDPSLQNHCVEGQLEWLEDGEPVPTTVLIPTTPVAADSSAVPQGNQGVTLDGVVIANAAPVDAILGAYTIAAFDDCGAHFNPFDGYHLHGAVGCGELEGDVAEGETAQFGYAMDGYAIHSPLEDESDLDACNGHTTEADGYHYHANNAAENQVVECLVGQTVAGADAAAGGGAGGGPGGPPPGQDQG